MRILIDTHALLRFLNGEKMPEKAKELIIYGENYVSVISLWEVAIKMNMVIHFTHVDIALSRAMTGFHSFLMQKGL